MQSDEQKIINWSILMLFIKNVFLQDRYSHLCAKYQNAKTMISSLKQSSHLLAEQLITRDEQYSCYLTELRERFLQLESELVETQRRAGLPVRLPYDQDVARNLLSPPEELKRQPVMIKTSNIFNWFNNPSFCSVLAPSARHIPWRVWFRGGHHCRTWWSYSQT